MSFRYCDDVAHVFLPKNAFLLKYGARKPLQASFLACIIMPPIFLFEKKKALILFFTSKIDIEKQLSLCAIILKRPLKLLLMLVCDCFATIFCAFISISITFALDIDKINRRMYNVIVTRAKSVMQLPDKKLITRRK